MAELDPQFLGHDRSPDFQTRIRERSYKLVAHEASSLSACAAETLAP